MPTVNVYLSEAEYVEMANRAAHMNIRAPLLIRLAVQVWLQEQKLAVITEAAQDR